VVGETLDTLRVFFDRGGPVLWVILFASLWLWGRIGECYFLLASHRFRSAGASRRADSAPRLAAVLQSRVSETGALIAVLPLLGLLGTIGGMIEAFDVLAYAGSTYGSPDPRGLSLGISRALLTTMAGLVTSLAGLLASMPLSRWLTRESNARAELGAEGAAYALSPALALRARLLGRPRREEGDS
jgi:biopolymer transport protein ExbB